MNDLTIDHGDLALAASVYGAPDAPPVLLLHGISNSRDVWYDWAAELSDRYRVFTLDFRGHGHSARAPRYTIADHVSDVTAVLEAIGVPTRVVGHSLGGVIAGVLSQQAHPLVHSALLVDPAWYFGVTEEFERTVYPRRFALLTGLVERLRSEKAPLAAWVSAVANTPASRGRGLCGPHAVSPAAEPRVGAQPMGRARPAAADDRAVRLGGLRTAVPSSDPCHPLRRRLGGGLAAAACGHADDAQPRARGDALRRLRPLSLRTTAFAPRFRRDLEGFLRV